jgi:hypothetical protein
MEALSGSPSLPASIYLWKLSSQTDMKGNRHL